MAMLSQQLQNIIFKGKILERKTNKNSKRFSYCTAIAIDSPSPPLSDGLARIRWGWSKLQGPRSEMEDDIVLKSENLDGFTFAAVFDGHAGFSSVEFLRDQLYKECMTTLKGGSLLKEKDFNVIKEALHKAFADADTKLMSWLEETGRETDSGATATVMFIGNDAIIVSHVGDSCVVLSRSGRAEALTWAHRPYGSNRVSLDEIRRIREAGGWIVNGRICGDISVSRAFGDMQFKTKKNEMLERGIKEGRWSRKFVSRIQFSGDLVTSSPDIYQTPLGSDVEFIILASDGLWDYISSKDAVSFVRNQLRQHGDIQIACDALARAALDQKSQDNISIVIADTGRTDWKSVPQEQQNVAVELIQALATMGIVSLGIWITSFL